MDRRTVLATGGASLLLAACVSGGTTGAVQGPKVYKITPKLAQEIPFRLLDSVNSLRAAKGAQRPVRILMDLGGPKIRTGDVAPRPPVLRLRPQKDEYGRPFRPYRLGLQSHCSTQGEVDADD